MLKSNLYSKKYFESERCEGYVEYTKNKLSSIRMVELNLLGLKRGDKFLDIGCGRGDLCTYLSKKGVDVWGIDYSEDAVNLTRKTVEKRHKIQILLADARRTGLESNSFDKILLGDIVEHMSYSEALDMVQEAHRLLAPNGTLVIHTAPNLWFKRIIYPCVYIALKIMSQREVLMKLSDNIKATYKFHEDEYTPGLMKKLFMKSNFDIYNVWVNRDILRDGTENYIQNFRKNFLIDLLVKIINSSPLVYIFGNDIFASAIKK